MRQWDAVVVGAGPAGALAALGLAGTGASVLLLDRAPYPRWKVCGACLSPGALSILERAGLGALPGSLGGVPLRRLVLRSDGRLAPVALAGSVALSRSALDHALVRAAEAGGATFWPRASATLGPVERGARLVRVRREAGSVDVRARVVIDASGLGRALRGGEPGSDMVVGRSRIGVGAVLEDADYPVDAGDLHMAVDRSGYVGVVRQEGGLLSVAGALDPERLGAEKPEEAVSAILVGAGLPPVRRAPLDGWRGTPLLTRSSPSAAAERLFRIGDAAGYVEPFTGEGICWALSSGEAVVPLAARAIEHWSDELGAAWQTHRRRTLAPSQRLCRVLAVALRQPWLVRTALLALGVAPGIAAPFVARAARPPAEAAA